MRYNDHTHMAHPAASAHCPICDGKALGPSAMCGYRCLRRSTFKKTRMEPFHLLCFDAVTGGRPQCQVAHNDPYPTLQPCIMSERQYHSPMYQLCLTTHTGHDRLVQTCSVPVTALSLSPQLRWTRAMTPVQLLLRSAPGAYWQTAWSLEFWIDQAL